MDKRVIVHSKKQARRGGFLKIEKLSISFSTFDGGMSGPHVREVLERGDSAGVLLHDETRDLVVCIEQFRTPAYRRNPDDGWVLETIAGVVDAGETPEQAARREAREETGYVLSDLTPIATIYPSVGGSTERIHMFYAPIDSSTSTKTRAGVPEEGEDIRIVRLSLREAWSAVQGVKEVDAKLLVALQWLALRVGKRG